MARPRGKIKTVCQNKKCGFFRKESGKDIVKRGFNRAGTQRYYCNHCQKYFVERSGTPLYRRRLSSQKVKRLCLLLVEKNGIRAISRITHLNKNTVVDWLDNLAAHAKEMTDYLVHDLDLNTYEVDEFWTFIKKTKRKMSTQAQNGLSKVNNGATPA